MSKSYILLSVLFAFLFSMPVWARSPVVGFFMIDAAKYFAEGQKYHPYGTRVLLKNDFRFGYGEYLTLLGQGVNENSAYNLLCQFNISILDTPFDWSIMALGEDRRRDAAAARQALDLYVREGGSVLLLTQAVRYPNDKDQDFANLVIEGLGVQMLHEGVFDPQRSFSIPIASIFQPEGFFWTENITSGHPVTEGVKRLCLPQYHNGSTPGVVALSLSPEWQVLVRGEASAQSYPVTQDQVTDYKRVGTYPAVPPIVAVRSFGKGRIMVYSVPARSVVGNYGVAGWNMIVEEQGNVAAKLSSDSNRMVLNGLKWLAETSRDLPQLGTFSAEGAGPVQFPESVEYDNTQFNNKPVTGVRGLLGAKTLLSEGTGTVADYVTSAKTTGLSFIVFNESLEKMTPEKLEHLKTECKQNSTDSFYACPGLEFSDDLGNRWAIWGERVVFPQKEYKRTYIPTTPQWPALKQWDGQVMHNPGQYWACCGYAPNMLLTYRNLREKKGHPANLWWFYRVPPYVYDRGKLVENNFNEWLYALRDIRHVDPAAYTRIYSPQETAKAANQCASVGRSLPFMRDWLNTRCANYGHPACSYVTSGPSINQWEVMNSQFDLPLTVRGVQRARCRFEVTSLLGIREVKVHDSNHGVLRRFLGKGQKTFTQEFELSHDRDHTLTLEVIDTQGKSAISDEVYLWNYKTSLFRCGDNLNFLNGVGLCWHPYNEMMPLAQMYQGTPPESIMGYDSASALTEQGALGAQALDTIQTEELKEYPQFRKDGILRKVLSVVLPGNDVKICEMTMDPLVEQYDSVTRDTPAMANIPAVIKENELFVRRHRSFYLQNRNNMFITWNYRRAREGAEKYRGGIVWHEGTITFKRNATLAGIIPIPLFYLVPWDKKTDSSKVLLVKDLKGGSVLHPLTKDAVFQQEGTIAPGGYLTAVPNDTYVVFFAPSDSAFRYFAYSNGPSGKIFQILVGLGQSGQKVTAGSVLSYRFGIATLGGRRSPEEYIPQLDNIAESFGIGAGDRGVKSTFIAGSLLDREMFLTAKAQENEVQFTVAPRETIIDLPICVSGVDDNGCAAVYSSTRSWFRSVGVVEGKAWFQENVDTGSTIWAGNIFVCDNKAVRMTLVADGMSAGRTPFLEVHNPTDKAITTKITSPSHAPLFGGTQIKKRVPSGSSIVIPLTEVRQ